ncbi:hypothetical protein [Devosia sp. CN2-171]|uniref:hypothetical protein n=1 Tax=Devosia sp. CN2-171 TaxID=3400909 RepID=UPI003BF8B5A6
MEVNDLPYVGLDPATSVGLGHIVRVASLRSILRVPSRILGPIDARLSRSGLTARRRLLRRRHRTPTVWVVDSGHLPQALIQRRLEHPATPVIWIRRGLFKPEQAAIQGGYLDFVDLVLAPQEGTAQPPDAVETMAEKRGKLARVGIVHAYQVLPAIPDAPATPCVFLALGAFTPQHRATFAQLRRQLEEARIPYLWSAHGGGPLLAGFPASRRVPVTRALAAKARCTALAGEAGYNSVYEALHLGCPTLLLANETEGREAQELRVKLAASASPNMFDGAAPGAIDAWLTAARDPRHARFTPPALAESHGLQQIAAHIERMFDAATPRTY